MAGQIKCCCLIFLIFLLILLILILGLIYNKNTDWCNETLKAGDCARYQDRDCYCVDEDTNNEDNHIEGIYAHAKSKCASLNGSLAVVDGIDLLQWLSKRLFDKGIDNAFIALQRINGNWYWMHNDNSTLAAQIAWRLEFPVNPDHQYATVNVETVKIKKSNENDTRLDDPEPYIYHNYDFYYYNDHAYKWYGFKTSDNFMNDDYFYRGAYYICHYSFIPDAYPLIDEPKPSNHSSKNNEENQNEDECFCKFKNEVKLSELEETQTFTSPQYPNNYCSDLNCRWMISAPEHLAIKFETVVFHLENKFDYLHIFDGLSSTDDPLMASCTGSFCSDLLSSKHEMQVHFSSDHVTTDLGFKVKVTAVDPDPCYCPTEITVTLLNLGDSYTLYSPNYPGKYCTNHDCHWKISAPTGYGLQLVWSSFSIENDRDYLTTYDGNSAKNRSLAHCTGNSCTDVISSGEDVHVEFVADLNPSENTGFTAVVTVVQNYCEEIEVPLGFVSYTNQRSDGKVTVDATATLICPENSKIVGTIDEFTDNLTCDGVKWSGKLKQCTSVCELPKATLTKDTIQIQNICELEETTDLTLVENGHSVTVEYFNFATGKKESTVTFECKNSLWSPNSPLCHSPIIGILLIGGGSPIYDYVPIELYSPFQDTPNLPSFELAQNRHLPISVVLPNGTIVIAGGSKLKSKLSKNPLPIFYKSTELVEPYSGVVTKGPDLNKPAPGALYNGRAGPGAIFQGELVICGGIDPMPNCEVMRNGRWELMVDEMIYARYVPAMAATSQALFVIDGVPEYMNVRGSVEKYTLKGWKRVASLNRGRMSAAAAVFHDKIVVCGGVNDFFSLKSCESYQAIEDRWQYIADMNESRNSLTMVVFSGRLFVMAGYRNDFKKSESLDSVERYDQKNNRWVMEERRLKHRRDRHSAIAFPSIKEH